jgi:hypothetical protein
MDSGFSPPPPRINATVPHGPDQPNQPVIIGGISPRSVFTKLPSTPGDRADVALLCPLPAPLDFRVAVLAVVVVVAREARLWGAVLEIGLNLSVCAPRTESEEVRLRRCRTFLDVKSSYAMQCNSMIARAQAIYM